MREPWQSQLEAVDWIVNVAKGRAIVADEMGLGKTGEVYLAWKKLGSPIPCIILAGVNAQVAWMRQAADWGCPAPVRIYGTAAERKKLWLRHGLEFIVITREALRRDIESGHCMPNNYTCVIADEAHKDSNRRTKNYQQLKSLTRRAKYVFLATGSAMRKGPPGIWGLLNAINPSKYKSYWRFVEQYCDIDKEGTWGWEIIGTKNEAGFRADMASVMIARTKKDVRPSMPPKVRDVDSNVLQMSYDQHKLYQQMVKDMLASLPTYGALLAQNVLTQLLRLRQILVSPKLLDPKFDYGAGIERLIDMLDDASDQHMVVFTPFTSAIPIIRQRLIEAKFDPKAIVTLSGGQKMTELNDN